MPESTIDVPLTVENLTSVDIDNWPVTSGVPLAAGTVKKNEGLALRRGQTQLPLQWEPLAFWPDGSVKWALLDFQTGLGKDKSAELRLSKGKSPAAAEPVKVSKAKGKVTINTGSLRMVLLEDDFRLFNEVAVRGEDGKYRTVVAASKKCCGLLVRDSRNTEYASFRKPVSLSIERRGPLHATVAIRGEHVSRSGKKCFSFVVRIHAFAGCDFIKVDHLIINDNPTGNFTNFREVALSLELADEMHSVRVGGGGKAQEGRGQSLRLFQADHNHYQLSGAGGSSKGKRAEGWVSGRSVSGYVTVAVKDFWQQWPKSLEVEGNEMRIGLCPALEPGQYDGLEPLEKWYYLFKGQNYRFKTGVAKSHEVWLRFSGEPVDEAVFSAMIQIPLIAAVNPTWAAQTGVWGDLMPAGSRTEQYDELAEAGFQALLETDEIEGQYGLLNWGDWFGERRFNWGNNEYDTGHALFLQFARTGDAHYFHAARRFARHMADVDIVHALNDDYLNNDEIDWGYGLPVHVGAVYLHAIGHVAGYFPLGWAKKRWPKAYYYGDVHNLGHVWNEGMLEHYYLTGDPWAREAALQVADNLVALSKVEGMTWWFGKDPHCGRVAGWPLTILCAAYQATLKQKYLRAARHIIEHALADQDENCGGWIYQLYPGHCYCHLGHVGMATFITAVLLNGMVLYHQITGDQQVAESIVRAVDFVISDTWVENTAEFRYTSCPASSASPGTLILRSIAYAKRLSGSPRHAEVLQRAWERLMGNLQERSKAGPAYGKSFAITHRELPRVLCDL